MTSVLPRATASSRVRTLPAAPVQGGCLPLGICAKSSESRSGCVEFRTSPREKAKKAVKFSCASPRVDHFLSSPRALQGRPGMLRLYYPKRILSGRCIVAGNLCMNSLRCRKRTDATTHRAQRHAMLRHASHAPPRSVYAVKREAKWKSKNILFQSIIKLKI